MTRKSKRPSAKRKPLPQWAYRRGKKIELSDEVRVPIPGVEEPEHLARYFVTPLGRVYRDDGRLLRPCAQLCVGLHGGRISRRLPYLIFTVFGRMRPPKDETWDVWIPYGTPEDPLTRRRSCSIEHLRLVPRRERIRHGSHGTPFKTLYPVY